ncbi:MAG: alpha/beta fold hydrolase [Hyphomicrobiaceae bacterium]
MSAKAIPSSGEIRTAPAPGGGNLEYEVIGTGEPLVLLHGAFTGRSAWSRQRVLAAERRLIVPSSRAHDGSERRLPPDYGVATSDVADLASVVDALGLDRFDLVGHSSGGATAFAYACRFPEKVQRLVLIEPTLLALLPAAAMQEMQSEWGRLIEVARSEGDGPGLAATISWLGRDAWRQLPADRREKALAAMKGVAHVAGPHLRALLDLAVTPDDVRSLPHTALLVYGAASFPFEELLARRLMELRPDWTLLTVPNAGHNCFRDAPDLVNAAIREHIGA